MVFKVGDEVTIKDTCDDTVRRYIGLIGVISKIHQNEITYPIEIAFYDKTIDEVEYAFAVDEVELIKREDAHLCGLVCTKCNPRDMINF